MYINLHRIQTLFPNQKSCIIEKSDEDSGVYDIPCLIGFQHLAEAPIPLVPHYLYLCRSFSPEIFQYPTVEDDICFLVESSELPDTEDPVFSPMSSKFHLLFIQNTDHQMLLNILQAFFCETNGAGLFADSLLSILTNSSDINEMVKHASLTLRNPVMVFDEGFNLSAYYINRTDVNKLHTIQDIVAEGGLTKEDFSALQETDRHFRNLFTSTDPICIFNPESQINQMMCAVSPYRNLGLIVVNELVKPFDDTDLQFVRLLRDSIHDQLQKNEFIRNNVGNSYAFYIKDLLDEKVSISNVDQDALNSSNPGFLAMQYCLVIDPSRSNELVNSRHIRMELEVIFPDVKHLLYDGKIVCLICQEKDRYLDKKEIRKLEKFCADNNLYGGLSNVCFRVTEIRSFYQQALQAIEFGSATIHSPGLFSYQDYHAKHLIQTFSKSEPTDAYCHPQMRLLLEYDRMHSSSYAECLYQWLLCERNARLAGEALNMHSNTVNYYIKKIRSLIHFDPDNPKERQYLIFSYELLSKF